MSEQKFENALRRKYRFDTSSGKLCVEDLYDLPLSATGSRVSLDSIARELHNSLKNSEDVSFVTNVKKSSNELQEKFDIVKYIIDVKLAERDAKELALVNKEKKQRILELIAEKQDASLANLSEEQLKEMAAAL